MVIQILRIGTRASKLALAQAQEVKRLLESKNRGLRCRLVKIKTAGDEFQSVELFKKNQTGVFTKEIEKKLLRKEIDLAVHSLKDLPTDLPRGLVLAAVPKRLDARDVLVSKKRWTLDGLPPGSKVGTGSLRRKRQLLLARPDLECVDIRGNLDTRIRRALRENKYDAVVVASAGLLRLKRYWKYARVIPENKMLPAVGQAALGIEARRNDKTVLRKTKRINHQKSFCEVLAERSFLKTLEGGCRVPVGIRTKITGGKIHMRAVVFSVKSGRSVQGALNSPAGRFEAAGKALARRLLKKGARRFLTEARA